jgi:hypothetical protein
MRRMGWMVALAVVPALALAEGKTTGQTDKQKSVQQFRAEDGLFSSPNFDIEGRISSVSGDKITISREDLPAAELSLASNTKIELDGDAASAQQLEEGQEVRAKFNLQEDRPIALEVSAERKDDQQAAGGSGALGGQPMTVGSDQVGGQQGERVGADQREGREQAAESERQAEATGKPGTGEPTEQRAQTSGQQAQKSVVGTVESLEEDKLSLKNRLGETHEFALGDDTRFTRGGQTISKDQISEGDEVRAAFRGEEGSFQATEIILMGGEGSQGKQPQQQEQQQEQLLPQPQPQRPGQQPQPQGQQQR